MDRIIEKKKWTVKKISVIAASLLFFLFLFYAFIWSDQSSKLNVEKDKITISTVQYGPFEEFIPVSGTVQPIQTFFLDVTEGGRVVKKYVEEGAFVNVGDPIVKFENAELTLSIIYNEANVYQQLNNLRSTKLAFEQNKLSLKTQLLQTDLDIQNQEMDFAVNKQLFEKNLISKIEYEKSKAQRDFFMKRRALVYQMFEQDSIQRSTQIDQLEKSVETLQTNLDVTKLQLENLTVRAPIKGQLTSLKAEIGQSKSRGDNLGQIDDIDSFKVRVEVDEHYITRVAVGQTGDFELAGKNYSLIIKTVYPEVTNGRFYVDMNFTGNTPKGIRRGQTLHIKLKLGDPSNALMVDRAGFYQTTGGQWIFVVDKSGSFAVKRNIKIGRQNPQMFEVLEGLKQGEKVITSSYDNYGDVERLVLK